MKNTSRVNVLQSSQDLVKEELNVIIRQRLVGFNDLGEVRFHKLRDHVNLFEILSALRLQDGLDGNDVVVLE